MKVQRKFTVLIERDEDGFYVATVPALTGCHTQAKTLDALMKRTREAIELCLEDDSAEPQSMETRRHSANLPMSRLPRLKGKQVVSILEKLGFRFFEKT